MKSSPGPTPDQASSSGTPPSSPIEHLFKQNLQSLSIFRNPNFGIELGFRVSSFHVKELWCCAFFVRDSGNSICFGGCWISICFGEETSQGFDGIHL
ncbi:hypothetical protein LINPERHAP2_LOCUS21913 [Linum perenne]